MGQDSEVQTILRQVLLPFEAVNASYLTLFYLKRIFLEVKGSQQNRTRTRWAQTASVVCQVLHFKVFRPLHRLLCVCKRRASGLMQAKSWEEVVGKLRRLL